MKIPQEINFKLYLYFILICSLYPSYTHAKQAPWVGTSLSGVRCTGGGQGYGPFDYTQVATIGKKHLTIVESAHFTPKVENLIAGNTSSTPVGDIDYTLRAWPNHHRALLSIIRYQLQIKQKIRQGKLETPPECYLQRAIAFSPQDPAPHSLFGYYLTKLKKYKQAEKHYLKALELSPNNSKLNYSYSLFLIKLKRYNEALKYAKTAYQKGRPPEGLKRKLIKLNVWK